MATENQDVMRERVRAFIDKKGISDKEIAAEMKVSPQNFSNYMTGKITMTDKFLVRLSQAIDVPFDSLRYGVVSKPKFDEAVQIDMTSKGEVDKNWAGSEFQDLPDGQILMTIPLVDQFAYAGYLSGYKDAEFLQELPKHSFIVPKRHTGKYRAFEVRGDSMDNDRRDAICAGDIAVGRAIEKNLWKSKFHLHRFEDYVIVHQEGILTKRISDHSVEEGVVTCVSTNPDKEAYPDFTIQLSEVYEIYNIVSVTQKRGRR